MPRRPLVWAGALVGLVALVAIAAFWVGGSREPEPPAPPLRIRPITSDPGPEGDPALSPDGHLLAFVAIGESGKPDLFVKQVDGAGAPLVISSGRAFTPAWSPDGQRIAFIRHVEAEEGDPEDAVFVISALGGPTRHLGTFQSSGHGLSWSPDATLLAVSHSESPEEPSGIFLLSLESGEPRRLTRPPPGHRIGDSMPRYSPDGRTLAFVRGVAPFETDLYLVPVDGGEERRLTEGNLQTSGLDWAADGQSIAFSSWRPGGVGAFSLWRVPVSGGDPEPLEFSEGGTSPTISRRGGRLAFVKSELSVDIWRVGGPAAPAGERSPTRLCSSTRMDYHARYSPDGKQIAFASQRSGAVEIWICDSDGASPRRLTSLDDPMSMSPIWSPNGQQIAFISTKEGSWDVYVVSVSGGVPRRLTSGSRDVVSSWSRDGRWVYFFSNRSGSHEVWKVSPDGGDPIQVTTQGGTGAFESHDGRFLYYGKADMGEDRPGIWRIPRDGGEEAQVLDRAGSAWWTLLEQGVLSLNASSAPPALELFDLESGGVSWAAPLEVAVSAPGLSVSPDGRWVLLTGGRETSESDIMLVEGFR